MFSVWSYVFYGLFKSKLIKNHFLVLRQILRVINKVDFVKRVVRNGQDYKGDYRIDCRRQAKYYNLWEESKTDVKKHPCKNPFLDPIETIWNKENIPSIWMKCAGYPSFSVISQTTGLLVSSKKPLAPNHNDIKMRPPR